MKRFFIASMLAACVSTISARVVTYPIPDGAPVNRSFSLEVRDNLPGSDWVGVDLYNVKVDETVGGKHSVRNSSMAIFDFDGEVEVRVTAHGRTVNEARVRPLSREISAQSGDSTVTFTLDRPGNFSVEVNGDIFDNIQLFAGAIPADVPTERELKKLRKDRNFVYFAPGYHKLDTPLKVKDNQRVYIAGGAFIDGVINVDTVANVKIWGRGVVYPSREAGMYVRNSRNVEIDGIMTTQLPVGGSDSVKINNVKVISYYGWGDGFNVFASSNVHYDGVFARTSDDCTTVYCTRKGFTGSARNITMENSTLWADVAHVFEIGLHGNVEQPDSAVNLLYRNIDVLDEKEMQLDYQGVMSIDVGDNNLVKNVTFDNIRIENFRQGRLLSLRLCWNKKYCGAPGRGIEDITFKDITYNGDNSEISLIVGYDETRRIKNVTFENLVINGVRYSDDMPGKPGWYKTSDLARIYVGEHVENVIFK